MKAAASTPARNAGLRKIEKSSSGWARRAWRRTKTLPAIRKQPSADMARAQDGCAWAKDLIARTRPESETSASNEDGRSQGLVASATPRGVMSTPLTSAARTTGRLIRNTEPHQKCSSSNPPRIGPRADPTTASEPQMAMARLRSRSSLKVRRISASVAGIMAAAPTANKARAAISICAVGEKAAARDATPNTTRPPRNIRRWPKRSPRVPAPNNNPAITSG
ncbi:hypothetical protein FQZ97_955150 [compost metagenome]